MYVKMPSANYALKILCKTLARLWQSDRDGLQGVFLQAIAWALPRKTTQQTARLRRITDRRELCRGSLTLCSKLDSREFRFYVIVRVNLHARAYAHTYAHAYAYAYLHS